MKKKITLAKIGSVLGNLILLQIYFLLYALRGGLILGVFPAFLSTVNVLIGELYEEQPDDWKILFQRTYKDIFKNGNIIGWIATLIMGLFFYDFYINRAVLKNPIVGVVIPLLIILCMIILTHLPIVLIKFEVKKKEYFKQAFYLAMSSIIDTVSIILTLLLIEIVFSRLPILFVLLGIPLIALPFAWFSYHTLEKVRNIQGQ